MSGTICPHCRNKIGFVCGTCCECGFNYLDKSFYVIKVNVSDLAPEDRFYLIAKHYERTKSSR